MSEENDKGDACSEMIHLVRAAGKQGVAVEEIDASSKSPLLARYHVLIIPTVLIFDRSGKVILRLEGEGANVVKNLRKALVRFK